MNTGQLSEIEDLLNVLNIEIDDSARISDGDITYFIFSSSNLGPEQEETLKDLEIDKIEDIYYSKKMYYDPNEILRTIKPVLSQLESNLWKILINTIYEVNKMYLTRNNSCLFDLRHENFIMPLKWDGKLATNDIELQAFINVLNKLIRESCKKEISHMEKYKPHIFWKITADLRNTNFHLPENGIKGAVNHAKRQRKAYEALIGKEAPDSNHPFDFINIHLKLLECAYEFLNKIIEDL